MKSEVFHSPPALPGLLSYHILLREGSSKATHLIYLTACTWAYLQPKCLLISHVHELFCSPLKEGIHKATAHVISELNPSVLSALVPPTEQAICFITGAFAT